MNKTTLRLNTAVVLLAGICLSYTAHAQQTFINLGYPEYQLLDRLETKTQTFNSTFSTSQIISRKDAVAFLADVKRELSVNRLALSGVDAQNIHRAISISGEWYENASGESGFETAKKPILKYFFTKKSELLHVETDDFFLAVNPVLYLQGGYELDKGSRLTNTRGLELRGRIADKIGFYTMLADNQEKLPDYVQAWSARHNNQMPGVHYAPLRNGTYDVFLARGYVNFGLFNEHLDVSFGYDKHHIGYGIRSMVYGQQTAPGTFLRLRSNWKKFNYESLILEQIDNYNFTTDKLRPQKYVAIHQLNYTPKNWLSVGIFESTVMAKNDRIPAGVFVPVIGFQSIAKQLSGNKNNNAWGLHFKTIPIKDVQVYGQAFLDQLNLSNIGQSSWKNQYGLQLGLKYFDVANISNLDGQIEYNISRPFTYTAKDNVTSFSHYNQPMAHPLSNNFMELIGNLQYQPGARFTLSGRLIYSVRGNDTGSINMGSGLFAAANSRSFGDQNAYPIFGNRNTKVTSIIANLNAAYELIPNLFFEAGGTAVRAREGTLQDPNTIYLYGGLRWNIARTFYDFN
jgi:hypothetical protein